MSKIIFSLISFYRFLKQVFLPILVSFGFQPHSCRHTPSCSRYFQQALIKYGTIQGFQLGIKRILSCHQFS